MLSTKRILPLLIALMMLTLSVQTALAQGVLVNESSVAAQLPRSSMIWPPRPPHPMPPRPQPTASYAIKSLEVAAEVKGQIAEVNVSQTFVNTGSRQMEVSFVFPLPYDGAIDSMVLMVDGKEYAAKLLDAEQARKTYQEIVRKNQDPALLEWIGTGMFKTSVFPVPAGASRTVQLKYTQLLKVDGGLTDFLFPMSTAKYTDKPIEKLDISVNIDAADEIKNVYSPTHEIRIKRPTPNRATVAYSGQNTVPGNDFRLMYDSGKGEVSTRLLSFRPNEKEDGYFMLLASPKIATEEQTPVAKRVVFVLDHSPSMSGNKIVQARDALKFVLNNLREGDYFNIVPYSNVAKTFKPELIPFNPESRAEAVAYTDSIHPTGLTNIDEALKLSFGLIKDDKMPNYIIFLTDGVPTAGERNEMKLAEIAKAANQFNARLFAFGVGFDLNARLLDRLVRDHRGQSEYVKPDEDIEERVGRLYNRISSPILTDVAFEIKPKGAGTKDHGTNRVYPSGKFDLFSGEQLVLVGRYSKSGDIEVQVQGKVGEESKTFNFEGNFIEKSGDQSLAFIPRLWALRRIGEILDQLDLLVGQDNTKAREEMVQELVGLSTQYGILTPYTSFLADENTVLTDSSSNIAAATSNVSNLAQTGGYSGVMQRSFRGLFKKSMQADSASLKKESRAAELAMEPQAAAEMSSGSGAMGGGGSFGLSMGQTSSMRRQSGPMSGGQPTRPNAYGVAAMDAIEAEPADRESNVQTVNNRAFFQKGGVWIDSTLTETQQKPENIVVVKQFSEDYFKLIDQFGKELTPYLALGGTQLVNLDGKAYRFEE